MAKTRFPHWLWFWTGPDENLFTLTAAELAMFEEFVLLAAKWEPRA